MKNVLITGGTGFIGAHLAKTLIERGVEVTILQHDQKKVSYLDLLGIKDKVNLVTGTITDLTLLVRILVDYNIGHVFHLAGITIVGKAQKYPVYTYQTNAFGTLVLLEACRMHPQIEAVVCASSDKCYGESKFISEEYAPLNGMGIYENSKACADSIARAYYHTYGLPVVVLRPANVIGFDPLNARIVPNTIKKCMNGERPIIFKGVEGIREYIYIQDVVDAYIAVAENIEKTCGEAFNVGGGSDNVASQSDMVKLIASHFGIEPLYIEPEEWRSNEIRSQSLNSDKIHRYINWKAKTPIKLAIKYTIEEFKRRKR